MNRLVKVHGCPHPFRPTRFDEAVVAGQTIEQIVERGFDNLKVPASLRHHGHAYIGDVYVPRHLWSATIPGPGDFVTYRIVPQGGGGGGGKNPLRTILTIVVIAVAVMSQQYYLADFATYTAGGALTPGSAIMSAGIAAGVTAVGMLAVNALVPIRTPGTSLPTRTSESESQAYSISGARNDLNPFGTVPTLLGRHRIVPPQGATPYTELVGNNQYVRQLFVLGYSGMSFEGPFKIGETELSSFEEVQIDYISQTTSEVAPKYYTSDIAEQQLSIELKQAEGWQSRVTSQECDAFSFDISCPQGLTEYLDNGSKRSASVLIDAQYRRVGDSSWTDITNNTHFPAQSFELRKTGQKYVDKFGWRSFHYVTISYTLRASIYTGALELVEGRSNYTTAYFGIATFDWNSKYPGLQNLQSLLPQGATGMGVWYGYSGAHRLYMGAGTLPFGNLAIIGQQTSAIRRTFSVTVPTRGSYEVRLARLSADTNSDKLFDKTWWATLRAIKYVTPIRCKSPLATVSLRARATGQLNGAIDQFNIVAVSECLDWDYETGSWVHRATNNPASLFRYVLQHPANTRAIDDSKIDLDQLARWHDFCRIKGFTYNRYHDFTQSVFETLRGIASAGRAGVTRPDGKWSVVIDEPRASEIQCFSPRNSWGFRFSKKLPKLPHAWRVRFVNEDMGFQSDERIVYADGYSESNAVEFETLELPGVTDPEQAWKLARYHFACAKLRPEEYEFYTDMEHIVCTRGDLIRVAHDVPLWGVASGRVKSVDGPELIVTVDDVCQMIENKTYCIRWRDSETGVSVVRAVIPEVGETRELMLDEGAGPVPAKGDLFFFGETGRESTMLIVKAIEPSDSFTARIITVDYSPAIFDADSGGVPAFETNITRPYRAEVYAPPVPTVTIIRSDEYVMAGAAGSLIPRIAIGYNANQCDMVQARTRAQGAAWTVHAQVPVENGEIFVSDIAEGAKYDISIRSISAGKNITSDWSPSVLHTVIGRTTPPPAPTGLYIDNKTVHWTMPAITPPDLAGWEVLITHDVDYTFSWAVPVSTALVTEQRFDLSPWAGRATRVWVRTIDEVGLKSDAVSATTGLGDAEVLNVVATTSELSRAWPGSIFGGSVIDGELRAAGASPMWHGSAMWRASEMWGNAFVSMVYYGFAATPANYGMSYLSVLPRTVSGGVSSIKHARGPRRPMWHASSMWDDKSAWGCVEISEWSPMPDKIFVHAGDEVYVMITTHDGVQCVIDDIEWIYDVEDAEHSVDGAEVPSDGLRIGVPENLFRWIKTISFGLEYSPGSTATGARYLDKGIVDGGVVTDGPLIQCIDSTGNPVAGRVDVRIQGAAYGG